jgi:hypothetical protein
MDLVISNKGLPQTLVPRPIGEVPKGKWQPGREDKRKG